MLGLIVVASERGPGLSAEGLFEPLLGAPLLARAIAGALPTNEAVTGVLVVPEAFVERARAEVVERFGLDEIDRVIAGGPDRASAVRAGLEALPDDVERVIVQEGARALVPSGLVDRVLEAAESADAASPAVTLRGHVIADEDGTLMPLEVRLRLRELQGPQVFPVASLRAALEGDVVADLAEAVAEAGGTVALVEGDADNLLLSSAADTSRALEVFSRRAVEYAFVYPKDLLPSDPLAAALDPGEVPGDVELGGEGADEGALAESETRGDDALDAVDVDPVDVDPVDVDPIDVDPVDVGSVDVGSVDVGSVETPVGDESVDVEAVKVAPVELASIDTGADWAAAADDVETRVPETDETTRMPAAPGPDDEDFFS